MEASVSQDKQLSVNDKRKNASITSSYWTSWLTHKQSVKFTLHDFDWIHIRRLEAHKKDELDKKWKKKDCGRRLEFYDFLQTSNINKEHPFYRDFILSDETASESDSSSVANESEEEILKRLVAIRRREFCPICDGMCRLFQRKTQRYYDYQNRHFLRSLRALRKESISRNQIPPIITDEEMHILYGKTMHAFSFLRGYKIPKINHSNNTPDAPESEWEDSYCSTNSEDLESDPNNMSQQEDCASERIPKRTRNIISRPKRESKFDYIDRFNSSGSEFGSEADTSSGTDVDSGIEENSEKSQNLCRDGEEGSRINTIGLDLQENINSFSGSDSREDILSLFPEEEDIRLPT